MTGRRRELAEKGEGERGAFAMVPGLAPGALDRVPRVRDNPATGSTLGGRGDARERQKEEMKEKEEEEEEKEKRGEKEEEEEKNEKREEKEEEGER